MPLRPFRIQSDELTSSIALDASTVGDTTVTVAAAAERSEEPAILEALYDCGADIGFKPFYHKANDFEYQERQEFCEALIRDFHHHLAAFSHQGEHDGNDNTAQIEAVHSAIHVDDLLATSEDDPLVIIDGNEQQGRPFTRALGGLRSELPVVGHCLQSESYYPAALLADLVSNHLANKIETGAFDPLDPQLPAPRAKHARSEWGQAFSAMYRDGVDYTPPDLMSRRGSTVRERICCWYEGAVAMDAGADRPLSDSLRPVIAALRRGGFEEVAQTVEEL